MFNLLFRTFDARCSTLLEGLAIFEAACRRRGGGAIRACRGKVLFPRRPHEKRVRAELVLHRQRKDTRIQPAQGVSI